MSKRAPHEGQEALLVMEGSKHFATLEKGKDRDRYNFILANPELFTHVLFDGEEGKEVWFWKKGSETGRAHYIEYRHLRKYSQQIITEVGLQEYQRKMGRIFGYSEEDIEAFVTGESVCSCSKCLGVSAKVYFDRSTLTPIQHRALNDLYVFISLRGKAALRTYIYKLEMLPADEQVLPLALVKEVLGEASD